jgi:hypothetical protein
MFWKIFSMFLWNFLSSLLQVCIILLKSILEEFEEPAVVLCNEDYGQRVGLFGWRHTQTSRLRSLLSLDCWVWSGQLSLASACCTTAVVCREHWSTPIRYSYVVHNLDFLNLKSLKNETYFYLAEWCFAFVSYASILYRFCSQMQASFTEKLQNATWQ